MEQGNRPSEQVEGVPHQPRESWDIGAISQTLLAAPAAALDRAHGPGVRYELGALTVVLFPPHAERVSGIVRLETADSFQEFYRQPQPAVREDGLIFETREHLITLSPAGEVMTYRRVPQERPQEPAEGLETTDEGSDTPDGDSGHSSDSGASRTAFQNALPESEGQPRVTYSGRLGTDPRTKQTPKGTFVMEFPVAVPVADREKPEWRSTVVFDEKAHKLDGVLRRGMAVDVVAYEHRKVRRDPKTGQRRERFEYYATAVTPKLPKRAGDSQDARDASERQRP
jgi:hypothetical protein